MTLQPNRSRVSGYAKEASSHEHAKEHKPDMTIETHAYGRAGLLGNPSDGYNGKTVSIIVKNFGATVRLDAARRLSIVAGAQDINEFDSIDDLAERVDLHGYYGGDRLVKAAIKRFHAHCAASGARLGSENFAISYATTIPRQVGLAGSSAIITATFRALMEFYSVAIPLHILPNLVLEAERDELGINAGLQDRVVQAYEGCVYMDFNRALLESRGYGRYEPIDPAQLPGLYIAFKTELGKVSGKVLGDIRTRYDAGDREVIETLDEIAALAEAGKEALAARDGAALSDLTNKNFDLRCRIMDISESNRELVRTARDCGASAKFAGSGGSIIGVCADDETYSRLEIALGKVGAQVVRPIVA